MKILACASNRKSLKVLLKETPTIAFLLYSEEQYELAILTALGQEVDKEESERNKPRSSDVTPILLRFPMITMCQIRKKE
jgi:hypothetical protein